MMNIPFVKTNLYGMAISSVLLVITLISLSFKGLTLGLDFTGGVSLELKYEQKADLERIRQSISKIENANFPKTMGDPPSPSPGGVHSLYSPPAVSRTCIEMMQESQSVVACRRRRV